MSDVKVSIDKDTAEHLEQTRKGKPRRFVMLLKSQKVVALRLFKKGRVESQVLLAKKEATGDAYSGVVEGKGLNLTFQIPITEQLKEAPTANQKLKEFLKEAADESFKAEIVMVARLPSVLDESDPLFRRLMNYRRMMEQVIKSVPSSKQQFDELDAATLKAIEDEDERLAQQKFDEIESALENAQPMPDAPKFDEDVSKLVEALSKLKPSIVEATTSHPERKTEVLQLIDELNQRIKANDVKGGGERLEALEKCLDELKAPLPKTEQGELKKKLTLDLDNLSEPIKRALLGPKKEKVQSLLGEFKKALQIPNYRVAGGILNSLSDYVRSDAPVVTASNAIWTDKFEIDKSTNSLKNYYVSDGVGTGSFGVAKILRPIETGGEPLVAKFLNETALSDPKTKDLLKEEAEVFKELGDHPNLPKCLGVLNVDGQQALLLEFVDGPNMTGAMLKLQTRLQAGEISTAEYWGAIQYMTQELLRGLAHLEDKGFVHSDVKEGNVLIDSRTGQVKIIDLGGSVAVNSKGKQYSDRYAPSEAGNEDYLMANSFDVFSTGETIALAPGSKRSEKETEFGKFISWLKNKDPKQRPTAREALAHPFLADSPLDEEAARRVITGATGKITEGTDVNGKESWDRAMELLIKAGELKQERAGTLIDQVSELLGKLAEPDADFRKLARFAEWEKKLAALNRASELIDETRERVAQIKKTHVGSSIHLIKTEKWLQALMSEIADIREGGAPEITRAKFADKWREIKKEAEESFEKITAKAASSLAEAEFDNAAEKLEVQNATQELEKLRTNKSKFIERRAAQLRGSKEWANRKSAEKYFDFSDNFSGALGDFEKTIGRGSKDFEKRKEKALAVAKKYFTSVNEQAKSDLLKEDGESLINRLRWRMNDLIASIAQIKA